MRNLLLLLGGGAGLGVFAAESLHAAGGIHQLLLAGKEGMAGGANFKVDGTLVGGTSGERVPASAVHSHFVVGGMNGCFHNFLVPHKETLIL